MKKKISLFKILIPVVFVSFLSLFLYKLLWVAQASLILNVFVIIWLFIVLSLVFAIPLFFWTKPNRGETRLEITIQKAGNYAQGYFSYTLALIILRDLLWLVSGLIGHSLIFYNKTELGLILIAPFILMILGRLVVELGPFVKEVKIKSNGALSSDFKIVQISDLHIGPGLSLNKIKSIVKISNQQKPDIIVLTGDIVDHLDKWFLKEIETLAELQAKLGVFFVPGNHEYYWGMPAISEKIRKIGIQVLLNENKIVEIENKKIAIIGITDFAAEYFSLEGPNIAKATIGTGECNYRILLAHQPKNVENAIELQKQNKVHDIHLQLSGHTHGGQFIPWSLIIRFFQRYTRGLYNFKIDKGTGGAKSHIMNLYVSQGTGFWGPPDRLGTLPEITTILVS